MYTEMLEVAEKSILCALCVGGTAFVVRPVRMCVRVGIAGVQAAESERAQLMRNQSRRMWWVVWCVWGRKGGRERECDVF